MKCKIPEISWHNRDPVLSVDIQPKTEKSSLSRLASGGTDSHVLIWSIAITESGEMSLDVAADLTRHQRAVNVVKWSPNGEFLASGDDESVIFIWKQKEESEPVNILDNGNEHDKEIWVTMKVLRGHMEDVYDLSWSPNSQFLVSGSVDNTAIIWDVQKGKSVSILNDHKGFVQGVAWDPKNQYIATLSTDRYLRIFDIQTKKVVHREKSSVLCEMCYKKFDYVFGIKAKKRKSKTTLSQSTAGSLSSITEDSGSGNNTSKSNSHSHTLSSSESISQITSKSNSHSHNLSSSESISPLVRISNLSQSMSSSQSIESTDRLVQLESISLLVPISNLSQSMSSSQSIDSNSTRRATRGVRVVLSRQGAEVAERSALKRKRTLEVKLPNEPPQTPLERPGNLQAVDEEKESADDEEIQWHVSSDDLALTRPIVKRRKEKVVYLDQRVMDVYLANTSGG